MTDGGCPLSLSTTIWVTAKGCEVLTARHSRLQNSEDKPYSKLGALSCYMGE